MIKTINYSIILGSLLMFAITPAAQAFSPQAYSLFGAGTLVTPGNSSNTAVNLVSDPTVTPGYAGIDYTVDAGTTFASLTNLSTDYMFPAGNSCGGGAPRFSIGVTNGTTTGNIFAYLGSAPSYAGCASGSWLNSGNLLSAGMDVDSSQLPGGTFYDPYSTALSQFGSYTVTSIDLVVDASFAFPATNHQEVNIDNTAINSTIYTYEPAPTQDSCKKDGWQTLTDSAGHHFKNQGDCVSFFATSGKNKAAGN